jgi:tetratricopeptide (TPR) repeat protein
MNGRSPSLQANLPPELRRALRACEKGEWEKAERLCGAVLERDPENFDALHCLGEINFKRGRFDAALALFQQALKRDISRADGFASLGLVFHALGEFERALIAYDEGLRLRPDDLELVNRRGVALLGLGRAREALDNFERVLACDAEHFEALANRGNALVKLNRVAEALAVYEEALQRAPDNAQLLANRAVALRRLDRPAEALMSARQALRAKPDFAQARFVESVARLTLGDFAAGWRGYEARWQVGDAARKDRGFAAPMWLGEGPLAGKTILLHAEQGFGDTLQFVRYAPLVAAQGASVILEVQTQLRRLLSGMTVVEAAVIARGDALPRFDCHCALMSLPLAFGTELTTIPAGIPYIAPDEAEVASWRARLALREDQLRVGLIWSGERSHDNDLNRSLRLATLAPLLDLAGVQFVSLQHEVRAEDNALLQSRSAVVHAAAEFRDFADTAAAISSLDLVISADTAVAHLAGAMGKPLMLLLPYAADFRWLRARADSPWYPTARLFRQPYFGDWESVIESVGNELMRLIRRPETPDAGRRGSTSAAKDHKTGQHEDAAHHSKIAHGHALHATAPSRGGGEDAHRGTRRIA